MLTAATTKTKMKNSHDKMSFSEHSAAFGTFLKMADEADWNVALLAHEAVKQFSAAELASTLAKQGSVLSVSDVNELAMIGGQERSDKNLKRLREIMIRPLLGRKN